MRGLREATATGTLAGFATMFLADQARGEPG
jgi:hypothetical protein